MTEQTKKTTESAAKKPTGGGKQTTTKSSNPDLKGTPEVSKAGVNPKHSRSADKQLVPDNRTPFDKAAGYVLLSGHVVLCTTTAVGAWFMWYDDWPSIAHVYWPLAFYGFAGGGLLYERLSRG